MIYLKLIQLLLRALSLTFVPISDAIASTNWVKVARTKAWFWLGARTGPRTLFYSATGQKKKYVSFNNQNYFCNELGRNFESKIYKKKLLYK